MHSVTISRPNQADRRSERVLLASPVLVYGWAVDNSAFHDVAPVLSLNAHGGVLALTAAVQRGQRLLLMNSETQEDRECRVVYVGPESCGKRKVAFEFTPRSKTPDGVAG